MWILYKLCDWADAAEPIVSGIWDWIIDTGVGYLVMAVITGVMTRNYLDPNTIVTAPKTAYHILTYGEKLPVGVVLAVITVALLFMAGSTWDIWRRAKRSSTS